MSIAFLKNVFTSWRSTQQKYNEMDNLEDQIWDEELKTEFINPEPTRPSSGFKIDPRMISDAIIGLSDGLTVPFALTAGLSSLGDTRLVVYGGMAELIAGAISMGLGGYLGAKSEQQSYKVTLAETQSQLEKTPHEIEDSIRAIFVAYEIPNSTIDELTSSLSRSSHILDFTMRFQHTLPEPASSRAFTCALTIALCYFVGGFLPLLPYIFVGKDEVTKGLYWSIGIMTITLFVFGYVKSCFVCGWKGWKNRLAGIKGALEMVVVGGVAAGAAMGLVMLFSDGSRTAAADT